MVALLAEGVDRNLSDEELIDFVEVALLAEGVDRNRNAFLRLFKLLESPSSQRAWIEI